MQADSEVFKSQQTDFTHLNPPSTDCPQAKQQQHSLRESDFTLGFK